MPFDVRGREATVHLDDADYELVRAAKDGNCLFHAAGHALEVAGHAGAELASHVTLRAHVVQYVADHAKDLNALGFKLRDGLGIAGNQQGAVSQAQGDAIDRRVAYLRGLRNWGDEACITALERLHDVEILVFDDQGNDSALGVRFYVPSHDKVAKLRLCIRLVGAAPVHYDVYLPDHDAERDGDNVVVEAPKKGGEISQSAKDPWAYHLAPKGLNLFCPALDHRQMAYSRAVLAALGSKSKVVEKPVSVALGDQLNVIQGPPAPVVAVCWRNRGEKAQLVSRSFSAADGAEELARVVEEPLILPLVRVDGAPVNLLDFSATDLIVDVERGKAQAPTKLYLQVHQRAFGAMGASASGGGLIAAVEIDLAKVKAKSEDLDSPARTRLTFDPAAVLPDKVTRLMTWQASPFQVVVSSDPELAHGMSAWTHAHVPSEFDVLLAEYLAGVPVKMLGDSPTVLADLGVDATVADLANPAIEGERPKGREGFAMPLEKETALGQLLQTAGIGGLDANAHNYLVEVAEGEWYASTSWASMASLRLDPEDGRYRLLALYWSGSKRGAYLATAADLADPGQRAQSQEAVALNDALRLAQAARTALNRARDLPTGSRDVETMFFRLRARTVYQAMWRWDDQERAEAELLDRYRALHAEAVARVTALKQHAGSVQILAKLGFDATTLVVADYQDDKKPVEDYLPLAECASLCEPMAAALHGARAALLAKGIPLDAVDVEGVKDFDLEGGSALPKGADWKCHVFDPPLKLTCAVTAGISSCAGGVTVSVDKDPSTPNHVLLWHLDANLSIPVLCEMERLWPKGKDAPAFRSIALVTPSLWELNKYRMDNLYPEGVMKDCGTVFLGRGSHWYAEQPVVAGCDLFGLDLRTEGQADLVFTYDIDKRTEALGMFRGVGADSEDAAPLLAHFRQNLFGNYRYRAWNEKSGKKGDGADPLTPAEMVQYVARVGASVPEQVAVLKRDRRATANKSCRVPAVSATLIDAVAKQSTPLLELPALLAAEKGEQELAHHTGKRWVPGSREGREG